MPQIGTPEYPNTLVSGALSRPWRTDQIWQELWKTQYNTPIWEHAKGLIVNNKGLAIEILIEDNDAKAHLLANGLVLGSETVMFRPYKGVFAVLRNVPLEATKDDVLGVIKGMGWTISSILPHTRISQQLEYRPGDNRKMLTGRWVCMIDVYPKLSKDTSGRSIFRTRAFGGRWISFTIAFTRPPPVIQPRPDDDTLTGIDVRHIPEDEQQPHRGILPPPHAPAPPTYAAAVSGDAAPGGDTGGQHPTSPQGGAPNTNATNADTGTGSATDNVNHKQAQNAAPIVDTTTTDTTADTSTHAPPPQAPPLVKKFRVGNLGARHDIASVAEALKLTGITGHNILLCTQKREKRKGKGPSYEHYATVTAPSERAEGILNANGLEVLGRRITVTYTAEPPGLASAEEEDQTPQTDGGTNADVTNAQKTPPAPKSPSTSPKKRKKKKATGKPGKAGTFLTDTPDPPPTGREKGQPAAQPQGPRKPDPADSVELVLRDTKVRCPLRFSKRIHENLDLAHCFPAANYPKPQMESVRSKGGKRTKLYTARMCLPRPVAEFLSKSRTDFGGERYRMSITPKRGEKEYGLIIPHLPAETTQYQVDSLLQEEFNATCLISKCDLNMVGRTQKTFSFHVGSSLLEYVLYHDVTLDGKRYQILPAFPIKASRTNRRDNNKRTSPHKNTTAATKKAAPLSSTTSDVLTDHDFIHSAEEERDYQEEEPMEIVTTEQQPTAPSIATISPTTVIVQNNQATFTQINQVIIVDSPPHEVVEVEEYDYPNQEWAVVTTQPGQTKPNFALACITTGHDAQARITGPPSTNEEDGLGHDAQARITGPPSTNEEDGLGHNAQTRITGPPPSNGEDGPGHDAQPDDPGENRAQDATPADSDTGTPAPPVPRSPSTVPTLDDNDALVTEVTADAAAAAAADDSARVTNAPTDLETTPYPQTEPPSQEAMDLQEQDAGHDGHDGHDGATVPSLFHGDGYLRPEVNQSDASDIASHDPSTRTEVYTPGMDTAPHNQLVPYNTTQEDSPHKTAAGPTPEQAAGPKAQHDVEPAVEPTAGAKVESLADNRTAAAASAAGSEQAEPTTEPTVQPEAQQNAEPAVELAVGSTVGPHAEQPPPTKMEDGLGHDGQARITGPPPTHREDGLGHDAQAAASAAGSEQAEPTTEPTVQPEAQQNAEPAVELTVGSTVGPHAERPTQTEATTTMEGRGPATGTGSLTPNPETRLETEPTAEPEVEHEPQPEAERQAGPSQMPPTDLDHDDAQGHDHPLSLSPSGAIFDTPREHEEMTSDGELSESDMETADNPAPESGTRGKEDKLQVSNTNPGTDGKRSRVANNTSDDEPRNQKQKAKKSHNPAASATALAKTKAQKNETKAQKRVTRSTKAASAPSGMAAQALAAVSRALGPVQPIPQPVATDSYQGLQSSADVHKMLIDDKVGSLADRSAAFLANFEMSSDRAEVMKKWESCTGPVPLKLLLNVMTLAKFDFGKFSKPSDLPSSVTSHERVQMAAHLLYNLVGITEPMVGVWRQTQPLPPAVGGLWFRLCQGLDGASSFPPEKMAQVIKGVTGRQIDIQVLRGLIKTNALERVRQRSIQKGARDSKRTAPTQTNTKSNAGKVAPSKRK